MLPNHSADAFIQRQQQQQPQQPQQQQQQPAPSPSTPPLALEGTPVLESVVEPLSEALLDELTAYMRESPLPQQQQQQQQQRQQTPPPPPHQQDLQMEDLPSTVSAEQQQPQQQPPPSLPLPPSHQQDLPMEDLAINELAIQQQQQHQQNPTGGDDMEIDRDSAMVLPQVELTKTETINLAQSNGLTDSVAKALQKAISTGSRTSLLTALGHCGAIEGTKQISAIITTVVELSEQPLDILNGFLPELQSKVPHVHNLLKKNKGLKHIYQRLMKTKAEKTNEERQRACRSTIVRHWGDGVEQALRLTDATSRSYCEAVRKLARHARYEVANDAVVFAILERRQSGSRKTAATTVDVEQACTWAEELDADAMPSPSEKFLSGFHQGNFEIVSGSKPVPTIYVQTVRIETIEPPTPKKQTPRAAKTAAREALAKTPTSARQSRRSRAHRETSEATVTGDESGSEESPAGSAGAGGNNVSPTPAPPSSIVASVESNGAIAPISSATASGAVYSSPSAPPSSVVAPVESNGASAPTSSATAPDAVGLSSSAVAPVASNGAVAPTSTIVAPVSGDNNTSAAPFAAEYMPTPAPSATVSEAAAATAATAAAGHSKSATKKRTRSDAARSRRPQKAPRRGEHDVGEELFSDEPNSAAKDSSHGDESDYEPGIDAPPPRNDEQMSQHESEAIADEEEPDVQWDVRLRDKFAANMATHSGLYGFLVGGGEDTSFNVYVVEKLGKNSKEDGLFCRTWGQKCEAAMKAALAKVRQQYSAEQRDDDAIEE